MATYNDIKKIKIGDNIFNLYDSGNSGGTVTKVTAGTGLAIGTTAQGNFTTSGTINHTNSVTAQTTQAVYPIKIDAQGHISAYGNAVTIPTTTSQLTNDSGFITSDSDEKVKSTPATAATTYYLIASTSSSENTATTSKHASIAAYTTADSGTSGYAELRLGNTTATSSAGGKEGTIRLYGTNATYYTTLKAGAVASSNKTITFPNATGTVALTSDLSNFVTSSGVTSIATTSPISGGTITGTGTISHATSGVGNAVTTAGFYKFKYDTYGHVTGVTAVAASDITGLVTIPTNTDENVKSTAVTAATTNYIVGSTTSTTTTGGLSKHASGVLYTTADTATSGYTQLRLGNTTVTTTAGGKEGQIRLYGTTATYYVDLKAGAPSANRTITFPNATGTVALTSDIPTTLPASDVSAWAKASTKPTYTASEVGALASNTTYVSTVTTTAGTHTAISSKSGAVSFNVPTNTSHLTNDSGFITASHTSTYSLPLAASGTRGGVQIGYSESGTNYAVKLSSEKMYVTVPWTDTKVTTAALTSGTAYYPILATGTGTATRQIDSTLAGLKYTSTAGTTSAVGTATLQLGNSTASGTANNEQGVIRMYGTTAYYTDIKAESGLPAANRTIYLPSHTGTMYLTCTNTTSAVGGATTAPVYVDSTGRIQVVTSIPYSLLTGVSAFPVLTATGTSTSTTISLANNTITQVPLTQTLINKAGTGNAIISLETASNTIVIEGIGIYRVTASVYIKPASSVWCNVFIKQGNDNTAFASATEKGRAAAYLSNSGGAINITQTIQTTNTTSCYVYLAARVAGTTGTVYTGNAATYLEVEQIG
jgi:endonuclease YncB( thermonuclease family)